MPAINLELLQHYAAYDRWARDRQWQETARVEDGELTCALAGLDTLGVKWTHLLDAIDRWLARIGGRNPGGMPDPWRLATIKQLEAHKSSVLQRWEAFLATLDEERIAQTIEWRGLKGESLAMPLGSILQQLLWHGQYHRGQISSALRAIGKQPPATDLLIFMREQA